MRREVIGASVGGFLTAVALVLILGRHVHEGETLVALSPSHGLHEGDLIILGAWGVLIGLLWAALRLWPRR